MRQDVKEIRTMQIACSFLLRNIPNLKLEQVVSNYYDVYICAKLLHEPNKSVKKILSVLFEVIVLVHDFVYNFELVCLDVFLEHRRRRVTCNLHNVVDVHS